MAKRHKLTRVLTLRVAAVEGELLERVAEVAGASLSRTLRDLAVGAAYLKLAAPSRSEGER